jgi:3-methylcrotonyl-CoA carboxylase alpha subunit
VEDGTMKYLTRLGGEEREFTIERHGDRLTAKSGDKTYALDLALVGDGTTFSLLVDGRSYDVVADLDRENVAIQVVGQRFVVHVEDERERAAHAVAGNKQGGKRELRASMPGIVIDIKAAVGDQVEEGKTLVVLEAMKMQNPLGAESAGKITRILCKKGEAVAAGALLLELE